ncbi:MAG: hypothetical protein KAQ99_08755 [Candidatus Aureabacteria bacterium]|nr:hypothetical protein [Candidatus Auribacterota bacterium]
MLDAEINTKKLEKAIVSVPIALRKELGNEFDHIQRSFLKTFRKTRLQGPPGIRGASAKGVFGTFSRASLVSQDINGMGFKIFTPSRIALRHETGGRITAAGGGNLAVPLSIRTTMYTARGKLKKKYKSPEKLKKTFEVESKGKKYLAQKIGGEVKPLYILKRSVRLKPRLEFYRTWDSMQNKVFTYINRAVDKGLKKFYSGQAWQ